MINIKKMMQQAQEMQFKLEELQAKFADIEVQGEAGDGLVKVTMTCDGQMVGLDINPSLISGGDKEIIEDLVKVAVNNTVKIKDERIQQETKKMMTDMGLPEDTKLPPV